MSRPVAPDDPGPVQPVAHAAAIGRGTATTITGQLIGRWLAELGELIRNPDTGVLPVTVGRWELLEYGDRERLTQIGYELLVRLDGVGALVAGSTQRLVPLVRDHLGRPLTSAVTERPRAGAAAGICTCGEPNRLGVAHWIGRPCYRVDEPAPVAVAVDGVLPADPVGDGVAQVAAPQAGAEDAE